jgi:hypothetical protein
VNEFDLKLRAHSDVPGKRRAVGDDDHLVRFANRLKRPV